MAAYRAYGVMIHSAVPLPEVERAADEDSVPEAVTITRVEYDGLPSWLPESCRSITVTNGDVVFRVPETADFRVTNGSQIEYCPHPGADEDKIRLYLLGTCMGALLLQRQVLPLHGSVIEVGGEAYAIVGESGAGKSTLTSVLLDLGFKLLTDDIAAVVFEGGIPQVMPSYPQQKMWQESLTHLGLEHRGYRPLFERETKYAVPVHSSFCGEPRPLAGIFELTREGGGRVEARTIAGLDRLHTLHRHTFRRSLIEPLGLTGWHFESSARLSEAARMVRLSRPEDGFTAYELAEVLLSYTKEENGYVADCLYAHQSV